MVSVIYSTNTDSNLVSEELYKVLRRGKEDTYNPHIFLIQDSDLANSMRCRELFSNIKEQDEIHIILDSVFSSYIVNRAFGAMDVKTKSYIVYDKLFDEPKSTDISLITTFLREVSSKEAFMNTFIYANRVSMISSEFGDAVREFFLENILEKVEGK